MSDNNNSNQSNKDQPINNNNDPPINNNDPPISDSPSSDSEPPNTIFAHAKSKASVRPDDSSDEIISSLELSPLSLNVSAEDLPIRKRVSFSERPSFANFPSFDSYEPSNITQYDSTDSINQACCPCCYRWWHRVKNFLGDFDRNLGGPDNIQIDNGSTVFIYIRTPLDGGYGWIVLFCATIIIAIGSGINTSFGILLNSMADDLKVDITEIAFIGSLQFGLMFAIAPVGAALTNKYGFRIAAFCGVALCMIGFWVGSLTTNTEIHYLLLGIFAGSGIGLCGSICFLIVGFYFEKYRAIAMGILTSGSGVGMFLISMAVNHLVNEYGWQRTLQAHGFLYTIALLLASFLKSVKLTKMAEVLHNSDDMGSSSESLIIAHIEASLEMTTLHYSTPHLEAISQISLEDISISAESLAPRQQHRLRSLTDQRLTFWDKYCNCLKTCTNCCRKKRKQHVTNSYVVDTKILDRLDIYYGGSIQQLPEYQKVNQKYKYVPFIHERDPRKMKSIIYTYAYTQVGRKKPSHMETCWREFKHFFQSMFDYETLKMSLFQLIFACAFLFACGFSTPFMFIMKRTKLNGSEQSLIPAIGLTSTVCRLVAGFVSYATPSIHTGYLIGTSLIMTGAISILSADYGQDDLLFQYFYCSLFSWGVACWVTLRTVLMVKALGLSRLTQVFGLVSFSMGLGTFFGTSFCGFLVRVTGGYDATFFFSGWCMLLAGAILCYVPLVQRHISIKHRPKKKRVRFSQIDAFNEDEHERK